MTSDLSLRRGGRHLLVTRLDEITELYLAIRAEPPYNSGPLYTRDAFLSRTTKQATDPDFEILVAHNGIGELIGFAFGIPLGEHKWWAGPGTPPPADVLAACKFAVIELNVRAEHRHGGLGTRLLTELLAGRDEPFAILTTRADTAARRLYDHLGWEKTGTAQHIADGPVFDQLLKRLQ